MVTVKDLINSLKTVGKPDSENCVAFDDIGRKYQVVNAGERHDGEFYLELELVKEKNKTNDIYCPLTKWEDKCIKGCGFWVKLDNKCAFASIAINLGNIVSSLNFLVEK